MKIFEILLLCLLLLNGCKCKSEKEYYENGLIKIEKLSCKDSKNVKVIEYYLNGDTASVTYENKQGELDGTCIYYDADGKIESSVEYVDGISKGLAKWYHENGKIAEEVRLIDGERVGPHKYYSETGDLIKESYYILLNGESYFNGFLLYNNKGQIISDSSSYVFLDVENDTISRNDTLRYWFEPHIPADFMVKAIKGDIDKGFFIFDSTSIEYVDPNSINILLPDKVGFDTLRIIYEIKREVTNNGDLRVFKSKFLLEKVFFVSE